MASLIKEAAVMDDPTVNVVAEVNPVVDNFIVARMPFADLLDRLADKGGVSIEEEGLA